MPDYEPSDAHCLLTEAHIALLIKEAVAPTGELLVDEFVQRQRHGVPHSQELLRWIADKLAAIVQGGGVHDTLKLDKPGRGHPISTDRIAVSAFVEIRMREGCSLGQAKEKAAEYFCVGIRQIENANNLDFSSKDAPDFVWPTPLLARLADRSRYRAPAREAKESKSQIGN